MPHKNARSSGFSESRDDGIPSSGGGIHEDGAGRIADFGIDRRLWWPVLRGGHGHLDGPESELSGARRELLLQVQREQLPERRDLCGADRVVGHRSGLHSIHLRRRLLSSGQLFLRLCADRECARIQLRSRSGPLQQVAIARPPWNLFRPLRARSRWGLFRARTQEIDLSAKRYEMRPHNRK